MKFKRFRMVPPSGSAEGPSVAVLLEMNNAAYVYRPGRSLQPSHTIAAPARQEDIAKTLLSHCATECEESKLGVGEHHLRVWRGKPSPASRDVGLHRAQVASWRAFALLMSRLEAVFAHIEPMPSHDPVYSFELRHLLILACTDVEAAWQGVMREQGATPEKGNRFSRLDYVKLMTPMRLGDWQVILHSHPDYPPISPFDGWTSDKGSLGWYDDYNAVKHDREADLSRAKFSSVVRAMAACFVMHCAQFGDDDELVSGNAFGVVEYPKWSLGELYVDPCLRHPDDSRMPLASSWTHVPIAFP